MASSSFISTIYTTTHSLLGESAARNLTTAIAHLTESFETLFGSHSRPEESITWQDHANEYISAFAEFLSGTSSLENTSILLALSTFLFLLIRNMSWTSRLGNLGRFSPFMRSPTQQGGSTKVSDSDFSYITADDLRKHQAEATGQQQQQGQGQYGGAERTSSPVDYGPERDTDVLILRNKRKEYAVHFPAYSIAKNELTVASVRDSAAKKTGVPDSQRIKLLYKGKNLKDDTRTAKQEGLKDGSEILLSIAEASASVSESDDDDEDGATVDGDQVDGDGKRRRNRGKRTKRRNRREQQTSGTSTPDQYSNLGVPLSQASTRTASPTPKPAPIPTTPRDKLNALQATLTGFQHEAENFRRNPPPDQAKREFEHKRLSETILTQVLLKLDAVETEGDADARQKRKDLVKETQGVLNGLDATMKQ